MYRLGTVAVVVSAFFINGCGSDSNFIGVASPNSSTSNNFGGTSNANFVSGQNPISSTVKSFDGTWSNGCEYDPQSAVSDSILLKIAGSNTSLSVKTYPYDSCTGTPLNTQTKTYKLTYPEQIALSDCYNAQKVNANIEYPVTINGVSFTQAQYEALPSQDLNNIEVFSEYDLLCTNQTGTVIYSGEFNSGKGFSDASRPKRADLSTGLNKIQ